MRFIIKKEDWILEDNEYKVHIPFENEENEDVVITFIEEDPNKFEELTGLISEAGISTKEESILIANEMPDRDIEVELELLSKMPGHLESFVDSEGIEYVRYVNDFSMDQLDEIAEAIKNTPELMNILNSEIAPTEEEMTDVISE